MAQENPQVSIFFEFSNCFGAKTEFFSHLKTLTTCRYSIFRSGSRKTRQGDFFPICCLKLNSFFTIWIPSWYFAIGLGTFHFAETVTSFERSQSWGSRGRKNITVKKKAAQPTISLEKVFFNFTTVRKYFHHKLFAWNRNAVKAPGVIHFIFWTLICILFLLS